MLFLELDIESEEIRRRRLIGLGHQVFNLGNASSSLVGATIM